MDDDATDVAAPPMLAQIRAAHPAGEAKMETLAQMREAVQEVSARHERAFLDLSRRVEELERRHQAAAAILGIGGQAPALPRAPTLSYPSLDVTYPTRAPALSFHTLDVKAIERDASIVVDGKLDGRSRRRKLVMVLVLLLVGVFGALGYMVALSYGKP